MILYVEIIGYIGNVIISCNMIPQVYKSFKTKSTGDLSYITIFSGIVGLSLISVYGYLIKAYPILAGTLFSLVWYIILLYIKRKSERNTNNICQQNIF
jgi:MtN3 and saliva related transmembrane protein